MRHALLIITLVLLLASRAVAQSEMPQRTFAIDAVALIDQQRVIEGKVDWRHAHGPFVYLFSSESNLKTFAAAPANYEIQQGGACGRMGPLSGVGSVKLFAVHDGRLYLFASEQCRRAFVASPESFLDVGDPQPRTTEESLRQGHVMIENIAAHSGMLRGDAPLRSLHQTLARREESGGQSYAIRETLTIALPDAISSESCWNDSCWRNSVKGDSGWTVDSKGRQPLDASQRTALMREAGRHPWVLTANRKHPEFIASSTGEKRTLNLEGEGQIECTLVEVHWQGATTSLGVDGAGRVRMMAWRGRGPDATIGRIEQQFSAYHDVSGFELPGRVRTTFNGKLAPELSGEYSVQAVNDAADDAKFAVTPPPSP